MEARARTAAGWQILLVAMTAVCAVPSSVQALEPAGQEPPAVQPTPAEQPPVPAEPSTVVDAAVSVAPTAEAAPPPAVEAAPTPPGESTAPPPEAPVVKRKVVLLPVAFTVYEAGAAGGLEAVPQWTEAARANIGTAATAVLETRAGLELVQMPELSAAEQQVLREHVALTRQIILQANALGGDWKARRADFDMSIEDGLAFLRDRSGAEFALLLDGKQAKQSGGSVLRQIALAGLGIGTGGGGMYMSASLIDLQQGKVAWFNDEQGMEIMGMTGSDVRHSDEAQAVLRRLFEPYPAIPKLKQ